jgi:hypothetical protein
VEIFTCRLKNIKVRNYLPVDSVSLTRGNITCKFIVIKVWNYLFVDSITFRVRNYLPVD